MQWILGSFLLIIGGLCTFPVLQVLFDRAVYPLWILLTVHVLTAICTAAGIAALASPWRARRTSGTLWWVFAAALCISMPLYGFAAACAIFFTWKLSERQPPPIVSDEITVPTAEVFTRPMTRRKELEILERIDVEPFVDIFEKGRPELKKNAIKFLSTVRSREAIRALQYALRDEDIEVRLYAAGVLNIIDDAFTAKIEERRRVFQHHPTDAPARFELTRTFLEYTDSGLLDSISSAYYYREILSLLAETDDDESCHLKAKAAYKLGDFPEARRMIGRSIALAPDRPDHHELLCSILFAQRDDESLQHEITSLRERGIELPTSELMPFWTA